MTSPLPPKAAIETRETTIQGGTIIDNYTWLRDPGYPGATDEKVLDHLKAENAYFEAMMPPHKNFTKDLLEELKGRIKEDDSSVPVKDGDYIFQ